MSSSARWANLPCRLIALWWLLSTVMTPAWARGGALDDVQRRFDEREQQAEGTLGAVQIQFARKRAAMEAQWAKREADIAAAWRRVQEAIEQKWTDPRRSTNSEWVSYSPVYETRSIVDFEGGSIDVSALVPVQEAGAWLDIETPHGSFARHSRTRFPPFRELLTLIADHPGPSLPADLPKGWDQVVRHLQAVLAEESKAGTAVLAGQIATRDGHAVTRDAVKTYLQQEILPTVTVDRTAVTAKDGVTRVKVAMRVPLVSDHLQRRARQYAEIIPSYARRHGLDPRLLYAIIHTESYFNPRAQAPPPAYGLMQLVPRAGARDAYNFLYRDDRVLDDSYLLDPAHNVELGAAYLHLLRKDLVPNLPAGATLNEVLAAAYTWGPGNVRQRVLRQVRLQDLTQSQASTVLEQRAPEATRVYLRRVKDRIGLYDDVALTGGPTR